MSNKFIRSDLTGRRFGRLLVVKWVDTNITPSNKYGQFRWECLCDCGKTVILQDRSLLRGSSVSCGCFRAERSRKPPGVATLHSLYCSYRCRAKNHNFAFDLSEEQFNNLVSKNCQYCGSPPARHTLAKGNRCSQEWVEKGAILCNRIDRINSSEGYTIDNCVPCCIVCNEMKMDRTLEEFLRHVATIQSFQVRNYEN